MGNQRDQVMYGGLKYRELKKMYFYTNYYVERDVIRGNLSYLTLVRSLKSTKHNP